MEMKKMNTHLELWLNEVDEKPTIISREWIEDFNNAINNMNFELPLFILAPSGIAGANIKEMKNMNKQEAKEFSALGNLMIKKMLYYKPVVLGFFDKYLLGGGLEFALACDIIITTSNCKIGFPEVKLGVIPGFYGIDLAYYKNIPILYELLYTGMIESVENINTKDIFNDVVSSWNGIEVRKNKYSEKFNDVSFKSLALIKERIIKLRNYNAFKEGSESFSSLFEEKEQTERMNAFFNKNKC